MKKMSKKKEFLNFIYFKLKRYLNEKSEYKKVNDPRRVKLINSITLKEKKKKKIDTFYKTNYGKTIPYNWHRLYQSYTKNFDEKYFPEFLYIPYFERLMNPKEFAEVFQDKSMVGLLTSDTDIIYPKIYISAVNGITRDENSNIISLEKAVENINSLGDKKLFIKPCVDSCSGEGCKILNLENGIDISSKQNLKDILIEYNGNFLVQECIENHESLKKLHPESINTFRVMTYVWNGKINCCPIILRIGQGKSNVDNAHAGGMFIGVKNDGQLCNTAFTEFQTRYAKHPDSGIIFSDYKIPYMQKIIDSAIKLHSKVPQLGIISWDLTLGKNEEVILIESNLSGGSIWLAQIAHGCGIFGENTAGILQYLSKNKMAYEF